MIKAQTLKKRYINKALKDPMFVYRFKLEDALNKWNGILSLGDRLDVLVEIALRCDKTVDDYFYLRMPAYPKSSAFLPGEQEHRKEIKSGYFPYIPYSMFYFVVHMEEIKRKFGCKSFLDIGSGIGDKVRLAKELGFDAVGIEYLDYYVELASFLGNKTIHVDAFDFSDYQNYDIIYMYHPISDNELYTKLVKHIISKMKSGQLLMEVLPRDIYDIVDELSDVVENLTSTVREPGLHEKNIPFLIRKK